MSRTCIVHSDSCMVQHIHFFRCNVNWDHARQHQDTSSDVGFKSSCAHTIKMDHITPAKSNILQYFNIRQHFFRSVMRSVLRQSPAKRRPYFRRLLTFTVFFFLRFAIKTTSVLSTTKIFSKQVFTALTVFVA